MGDTSFLTKKGGGGDLDFFLQGYNVFKLSRHKYGIGISNYSLIL